MFKTKILPNGLTIAAESIRSVRSIAVGIFVKNGSRHETKEVSGISHFIEHMMFKGTKNRSARQIADEMDSIGGQLNAYTTKEYTCYYARALDTHIDQALDILTDMFFHSEFDSKEVEKEKGVILEEINMYEDSPEELAHDLIQKGVWQGSSLGEPILGTAETIESFSHEILKKYYSEKYVPERTVVAIAGNFEDKEMQKRIEKYFGGWERKQSDDAPLAAPQYYKQIVKKAKDIEQVHICLSFPGIPVNSEDVYAMIALNTILGGGMSSRLFQKIREERGLAYSVYSYASNYQDTGLFTIYAGMSPGQTMEVMRLVIEEIESMKKEKIDEKDLLKTKEQLKSNYILGLESTSSRMSSLGKSQLLLGKIKTQDEILQKLDKVTEQQIERLIKETFDFSQMSMSIVGKLDNLNIKEIEKLWTQK